MPSPDASPADTDFARDFDGLISVLEKRYGTQTSLFK
jgi:hypothetical protein